MVAPPAWPGVVSAACHGADDQQWFGAADDGFGQWCVVRFVGQVFFAGEESYEGAAPVGAVVPDGACQDRVVAFEDVEHGAERGGSRHVECQFAVVDVGEFAQVCRQVDADRGGGGRFGHGRVCTSTDRTDGRSRTMGIQVSPASGEAYTCPPVVPK